MLLDKTLIPPPGVVRERLAKNIREGRLLRAQLRVSERAAAAEERHHQPVNGLACEQHAHDLTAAR